MLVKKYKLLYFVGELEHGPKYRNSWNFQVIIIREQRMYKTVEFRTYVTMGNEDNNLA